MTSEVDLPQLVSDMSLEMIEAENLDNMVTLLEEKIFNCIEQPNPSSNQSHHSKKKENMIWKWVETTEEKRLQEGKGI